MSRTDTGVLRPAQNIIQSLAIATIAAFAITAVALSGLAAAGIIPWLDLSMTFGGVVYAQAGMIVQLAVTLLLVSLCFFIPSSLRVLRLERTHRDFSITMSDVADAYAISHAADREGVFTMSSEFDSVKERIMHLRNHPDLPNLEGEVLEAAAEMSHTSRELASIYSDEKVERAKSFLVQRQEDIAEFQNQIVQANHTCRELKRWLEQVEVDEAIAESQLSQLEETLSEILPRLGLETKRRGGNVFTLAAE